MAGLLSVWPRSVRSRVLLLLALGMAILIAVVAAARTRTGGVALSAQPPAAASAITQQAIEQALEPIRQRYGLPALGGALVTDTGLVAAGVTGVRKKGTDVPATVADQWHLGSDTKAITAVLIGRLVENGVLRWNSTLADLFPDLGGGMDPAFRSVTPVQLLSHHAGVPENLDWPALAASGSVTEQRLRAVQIVTSTAPLSTPGTEYLYSNAGYVIVGAVAERATGQTWEDLIQRYIFAPLGMTGAGFGGTGTPGQIDQPWPHSAGGSPAPINGPGVDNPPVMAPAATVHATLTDWAAFIADQLAGSAGKPALLQPGTYTTLHTPPFDDGSNYALGWLALDRPWGGGTVLTHAGSNSLNYAVVWMAPLRNVAVLAVANQGGDAAQKALDAVSAALIEMFEH